MLFLATERFGCMKRIFLLLFLLIIAVNKGSSQSFTDSNLPVILINTDGGAPILDNPRVGAVMKIIYRGPGQRNYLSDQNTPVWLNYNGRIDIEIRGSSSQFSAKKQYGFTTRMADNITVNNVSLLGMPAENDWILNAMVYDSSLIRDYLSYNLSRQMGEYATRTEYCEVMINGSYRGLYLLQEKIKPDNNRVDVMKITPADNYLPEVSGGYITKADKTNWTDPVAWTMYSWHGAPVDYIHDLPKPADVTPLQNSYIHSQFDKLASTAMNNNASIRDGFPSVIDIPSFVDYMIIAEFSSNADVYQFSTYFHKDRNGKLRAGPIWDYDLTYGNDLFFWGYNRSKSYVWQFTDGENDGSKFWKDLYMSSEFNCYFAKRWNELIQPGRPFNRAVVYAFIDKTVDLISEAVVRENNLWQNVGIHTKRITQIKNFIDARIQWMSARLNSFSSCSNVAVPPLVITKIMYNPAVSVGYPVPDDLEFIEITNNGEGNVNTTGIYFSGTGLVFQFPSDYILAPLHSVVIASNASAFENKYGVAPFGQYTRHLSDRSQNIILADAFGNVIDSVFYFDATPWPDADGNGFFLKLTDPSLDNSVASSWIASNNIVFSVNDLFAERNIQVYPNPVRDILKIESESEIISFSLYDFQGRLISSEYVNREFFESDMSGLPGGVYIIKMITAGRTCTGKIIKQ
jgi:hypothetical protein